MPACGPDQALRLFVADELIEAGVTPQTLMKAQGFDPAPLDLLKAHFNPDQPRWPAGSGRERGRWPGGSSVDSAGVKELIARLLPEAARRPSESRPSELKPLNPDVVNPEAAPLRAPGSRFTKVIQGRLPACPLARSALAGRRHEGAAIAASHTGKA